jgi:succinylglutamate desuccinylase/aspartoacylase family protein
VSAVLRKEDNERLAPTQETSDMQRFGKNTGGYRGEKIDIRQVLRDILAAAQSQGWTSETFLKIGELRLFALHRKPLSTLNPQASTRIYISTGIHGDEPAGPLAVRRLLQENKWPECLDIRLCPCLNPTGFLLNRRENAKDIDLNRQYLKPAAEETLAHVAWLDRQPKFDLCLCLHEDWESRGFYLYEQNPDHQPSLAEAMIETAAKVCPIDRSEFIEGRPARNGIIRPNLDPRTRSEWPEAFFLIMNKTRLSYTLEAPSDFPLQTRVDALTAAANTALAHFTKQETTQGSSECL